MDKSSGEFQSKDSSSEKNQTQMKESSDKKIIYVNGNAKSKEFLAAELTDTDQQGQRTLESDPIKLSVYEKQSEEIEYIDPEMEEKRVANFIFDKVAFTYSVFIHTSELLGNKRAFGNSDFYFRWQSRQPGCLTPICNHMKAINYFIASLNPNNKFLGVPCDKLSKKGLKKNEEEAFPDKEWMGFHNEAPKEGVYCINLVHKRYPHCHNCISNPKSSIEASVNNDKTLNAV